MVEYLAHELRQVIKVLIALQNSVINLVVDISEIASKVFQLDQTIGDHILFRCKGVGLGVSK